MKIIDMNNKEALLFFLKSSSYCNLNLPKYFDFGPLLLKIHNENPKKVLKNFYKSKDHAKYYANINYNIMINKTGDIAWRKICLTNPIAYVGIVQEMCRKDNWNIIIERFKEFKKNEKIKCCSIPVESDDFSADKKEQILNWWTDFEQKIIAESLKYNLMYSTDIANCYPSIYTHTIPWALHGKEIIKEKYKNKNNTKLYGDILDSSIQAISYGQTNGIPQGSILYDFIAEIVLGYIDLSLSNNLKKLKIDNYKIIRYRDDYRIFSNNNKELNIIIKELQQILSDFNLQINGKKTYKTDDILSHSLKNDKVYGLLNPLDNSLSLQKKIFVIREISKLYPNSGLMIRLLHSYYKNDLLDSNKKITNIEQIVSLVVDIMKNNSRLYPECIAILSKILSYSAKSMKLKYIKYIRNKLKNTINSDYLNIWLQRLTITGDVNIDYSTLICNKIKDCNNIIWESSWSDYKIDESIIINREVLNNMKEILDEDEIDEFLKKSY